MADDELPTLMTLDEVTDAVRRRRDVYVRWSASPERDCRHDASTDGLTGTELPGLSANPLDVAPWWEDRPVRLWVARRLHDYGHLREGEEDRIRPWILTGQLGGRGPDNEPLVRCAEPIAWIDPAVVDEAAEVVSRESDQWGPLRRGD